MQAPSWRRSARAVLIIIVALSSIALVYLVAVGGLGDIRVNQGLIDGLSTGQVAVPLTSKGLDSAQTVEVARHPFSSGDANSLDTESVRLFIGQIVERGSRAPVAARIRVGDSISASTPYSGRFSLRVNGDQWGSLEVSHPGYEQLVVGVSAVDPFASTTDLGCLELVPVGRARIRVLGDDQSPVAGAKCELRPPADHFMYGYPKEEVVMEPPLSIGASDDNGILEFRVGRLTVLWVTAPDGRVGCTSVYAGSDTTLQISGPKRRISVVEVSSLRQVRSRSFPFSIRRTGAVTVSWLLADSEGDIEAPCGPCDFSMDMGRGLTVDSVRVNGEEVDTASIGSRRLTRTFSASDTQIEVLVQVDEWVLHVVDSSNDLPVTGFAWVAPIRVRDEGEEVIRLASRIQYPIVAGRFVAPQWFVESVGLSAGASRTLSVPGFRVESFPDGVDLRGTTLYLTPSPEKKIQFLTGAARAYRGRAFVSVRGGPLYDVTTTDSGVAGPLPWQEGDEWDIQFRDEEETSLGAAEIAESDTVVVRYGIESGAILVDGIPENAPPLFAYSAKRGWIPLAPNSSTASASDVAVGLYRVGTRAWIEQCGIDKPETVEATDLLMLADQNIVKVDQVTKLSWDTRWWAEVPTRGRIVCSDIEPSQLLVLPITGDLHCSLPINEQTPWRSLDEHGWFEFQADSAQPSGFAVARMFSTGWRGPQAAILDVFPIRVDNTYQVNCTSIQLEVDERLSDNVPDKAIVFVIVSDQGRSAPTSGGADLSFLWDTKLPLRRFGIPASAERISISGRGFKKIFLDLKGGEDNSFDVAFH